MGVREITILHNFLLAIAFLLAVTGSFTFSAGVSPSIALAQPLDAQRPIEAIDTVFIEEMTWMEVRDALRGGKDRLIIPTGGTEQNGPYLALGKHNYITRKTSEMIARELGDTLVAPVVAFVPEGDISPPSLHMNYPGTISVRVKTFKSLLIDIASSFRTHGFRQIILLGDSYGNQAPMKEVAAELGKKWSNSKSKIHYVPEFYNYGETHQWLRKRGINEKHEGYHDNFSFTAQLAAIDPELIRSEQRRKAGRMSINGISLLPFEKTRQLGKEILERRTKQTVQAILKLK